MNDGVHGVHSGFASPPRVASGHQLVQNDSHREQVAARVGLLPENLFGDMYLMVPTIWPVTLTPAVSVSAQLSAPAPGIRFARPKSSTFT